MSTGAAVVHLAQRVARMPADAVQGTKKLLLAGKIEAVRTVFAREVEC
jgi:hypothetical protein